MRRWIGTSVAGAALARLGGMRPSTRLLATGLLACAVSAGRPAWAQTAGDTPPADASQPDGTVLRLRVGPTYLGASIGFGEIPARSYSGGGFAFDVEIGGALSPSVTLGAEVFGALALDASTDGSANVATGESPTSDLSTAGVGPSVTYTFHRFDRGNIYFAVNPAFTIVRASDPDHFFLAKDWGSNYFGVGIAFVVGAEWHLSSGWRIGPVVEARYAALSGNGDVSTMSEYALFFSASYD
jgi:hypothetical protein